MKSFKNYKKRNISIDSFKIYNNLYSLLNFENKEEEDDDSEINDI